MNMMMMMMKMMMIFINAQRFSCKVSVILVSFQPKFEFSRQIFEKFLIPNFMKIPPVEAELFHADRQTDGETGRS